MELIPELDTNMPPNLGEPEEPLPEFLEFLDQELTDPDKPLSVICVERVECSLP
jgi:hypothetical protein